MDITFSNSLDMTGVLGEYIVHNFVDKILSLRNVNKSSTIESDKLKRLIYNHFNLINNWCTNIEFFGLPKPQKTENITLELSITTNIRKLNAKEKAKDSLISEKDILSSNENILLLGDPGSGKTTTLKRITYKILYPDKDNNFLNSKFPLLLRLKDLKEGDSIFTKICDIVGISYERFDEPV
jgi:predicted NACHT family NTPase